MCQYLTAKYSKRLLIFCLLCFFAGNPALAGNAAPAAWDETAERRFNVIVAELRCLVCQNESLASSNAELAHDLRREIRGMIEAGKSDDEIMEFMVGRYGDFARYRPPLKGTTLLLWFGPALLLAGGVGGLFVFLRRRSRAVDLPLSEAERRKADRLLRSSEPES
ncbi:MAG: cytochrome c-type biogenesis protein CcmH [Candidatus Accumulibacter sp.]|jgi:cytochrome c-type biogenesis protein CcmH|nr:cytochrome c-type biogenesis protein CcmH [Accumulibacter sp.]